MGRWGGQGWRLGGAIGVVWVTAMGVFSAWARPPFVNKVPTPFRCDTCHDTPEMRQWRNGFGIDFATHRTVWATNDDWGLCDLDSDGDGIRNGDELGDPQCVWREGDPLPNVDATNPGESRDPDRCGDGFRHPGEECDGPDLAGQTCLDHGFVGGALGCAADCTFDRGPCIASEPDAAPPAPDAAPPAPDFGPAAADQGSALLSDAAAGPRDAVADASPRPDSDVAAGDQLIPGEPMDGGRGPAPGADVGDEGCQLAPRSSTGGGWWLGVVLVIGLVGRGRRPSVPTVPHVGAAAGNRPSHHATKEATTEATTDA